LKKIAGAAFAMALTVSLSWAEPIALGHWVLGLGPLLGNPTSSNSADQLEYGFGGEAYLGYDFDGQFSLGVESGYQGYPVKAGDAISDYQLLTGKPLSPGMTVDAFVSCIPVFAMAKYAFTGKGFKPYALLGAGLAFNFADATIQSGGVAYRSSVKETDFLLSPGFGGAFTLSKGLDFFTQGRLDLNFTSNNYSDTIDVSLPSFTGGVPGNLSQDHPTINIVVQSGLNISL
jgi:hypothetical protein